VYLRLNFTFKQLQKCTTFENQTFSGMKDKFLRYESGYFTLKKNAKLRGTIVEINYQTQ